MWAIISFRFWQLCWRWHFGAARSRYQGRQRGAKLMIKRLRPYPTPIHRPDCPADFPPSDISHCHRSRGSSCIVLIDSGNQMANRPGNRFIRVRHIRPLSWKVHPPSSLSSQSALPRRPTPPHPFRADHQRRSKCRLIAAWSSSETKYITYVCNIVVQIHLCIWGHKSLHKSTIPQVQRVAALAK